MSTPKRKSASRSKKKAAKSAYHHGDLRNALLDAAEALLEEGGIETLSLRDAARRAGVSHAAPYRHFPAKLDLLCALAERGFRALDAEMRRAGESSTDPVEQLEEAGFAYIRLAVRHPWRTQLMFGGVVPMEEVPAELQEIAQSSFLGLVAILERGQASGDFVADQDVRVLSLTTWSLVHGTAMLVVGGQFGIGSDASDEELRAVERLVHRNWILGVTNAERRAELAKKLVLPELPKFAEGAPGS